MVHTQIRACQEHRPRHAICTWLHIQKWYNHVSLRDFAPCFNLGGSGCSAWAVHGWETSESCFGGFANEEMLQSFSYLWFPVAVCTKTWNILEWPEVRTGTSITNTMSLPTLYFHYLVFCVFLGPGVYVVVTSTKPAPGCEETHVDSDRERDIKSNVWLVWPTLLLCSNCWTSAAPVHVDMVRDMVLSCEPSDVSTEVGWEQCGRDSRGGGEVCRKYGSGFSGFNGWEGRYHLVRLWYDKKYGQRPEAHRTS